jgi:predicted GNAT family N-acyltransferase
MMTTERTVFDVLDLRDDPALAEQVVAVRQRLDEERETPQELELRAIDTYPELTIHAGAFVGDLLVSVGSLEIEEDGVFKGTKFVTRKEYENNAMATKVMLVLLSHVYRRRGARMVYLESRLGKAKNVYEKVGFRAVGSEFLNTDGVWNQRMELEV